MSYKNIKRNFDKYYQNFQLVIWIFDGEWLGERLG